MDTREENVIGNALVCVCGRMKMEVSCKETGCEGGERQREREREREEGRERVRACLCVCVCEMNLTGEKEGIVPSWSVVISPRSGLEKCGQKFTVQVIHFQFQKSGYSTWISSNMSGQFSFVP